MSKEDEGLCAGRLKGGSEACVRQLRKKKIKKEGFGAVFGSVFYFWQRERGCPCLASRVEKIERQPRDMWGGWCQGEKSQPGRGGCFGEKNPKRGGGAAVWLEIGLGLGFFLYFFLMF